MCGDVGRSVVFTWDVEWTANMSGAFGIRMGTYISQHVVQARWLMSFPLGAISACVFRFFFAEM
jgi:hypothetical protein